MQEWSAASYGTHEYPHKHRYNPSAEDSHRKVTILKTVILTFTQMLLGNGAGALPAQLIFSEWLSLIPCSIDCMYPVYPDCTRIKPESKNTYFKNNFNENNLMEVI